MKITFEFTNDMVNMIVDGIMENFPEASASLECIGWNYEKRRFLFIDSESGERYDLDEEKMHEGFRLMFKAWPTGCTQPPLSTNWEDWDNWLCQSDATDFDAFVQLALLGEVVYG